MALANYTDLKAAVATWLNRTDLTDQIPDFITLAETRLNRLLRLRLTEVDAPLTVAASGTTVALPAAFSEPIGLWVQETEYERKLRFLESVQMEMREDAGQVEYWTINGSNIEFERPTDRALTLRFRYLSQVALSDDSPTNDLLTQHPDVYLFGALCEAGPYLRDTEALSIWDARLQKAIVEVNSEESRSRSLTTLSTDVPLARARWDWMGTR